MSFEVSREDLPNRRIRFAARDFLGAEVTRDIDPVNDADWEHMKRVNSHATYASLTGSQDYWVLAVETMFNVKLRQDGDHWLIDRVEVSA